MTLVSVRALIDAAPNAIFRPCSGGRSTMKKTARLLWSKIPELTLLRRFRSNAENTVAPLLSSGRVLREMSSRRGRPEKREENKREIQ